MFKRKKKEQKYFISYATYNDSGRIDFMNTIVFIDEPITMKFLEEIETSIKDKINEYCDPVLKYFGVQIISMNKVD